MRPRSVGLLAAALILPLLGGCGGVDYDHPSYVAGYDGGTTLVGSLGGTERALQACEESLNLSSLSGGVVGGDSDLALRGCYDAVYDRNMVPENERIYDGTTDSTASAAEADPTPIETGGYHSPYGSGGGTVAVPPAPRPSQPPTGTREEAPSESPASTPEEVTNPANARIATTDYRADLTVNADADQIREGDHLLVRQVKLRQFNDGSFTATTNVYNPQQVPIQAVLILTVLNRGSEVTSHFADGPCIAPGESRSMTWDDSIQGDPGSAYDDVAFTDSSSRIGC